MTRDRINDEYFEWIFNLVCGKRYAKEISYRKLLIFLHDTEFVYSIPNDVNRAEDGIDLRYRFALSQDQADIELYLDGPCTVLEMMVALAIHCEESIMDDPQIGDRTRQWFWLMVSNLGLGSMTDDVFDKQYAQDTIDIFLDRDYEPDGKGGLFRIRNCDRDLRTVEIWWQLLWYLDTIV